MLIEEEYHFDLECHVLLVVHRELDLIHPMQGTQFTASLHLSVALGSQQQHSLPLTAEEVDGVDTLHSILWSL